MITHLSAFLYHRISSQIFRAVGYSFNRKSRGAAALEFALMAPIYILLIINVVELMFYARDQYRINFYAREAVNIGAVSGALTPGINIDLNPVEQNISNCLADFVRCDQEVMHWRVKDLLRTRPLLTLAPVRVKTTVQKHPVQPPGICLVMVEITETYNGIFGGLSFFDGLTLVGKSTSNAVSLDAGRLAACLA